MLGIECETRDATFCLFVFCDSCTPNSSAMCSHATLDLTVPGLTVELAPIQIYYVSLDHIFWWLLFRQLIWYRFELLHQRFSQLFRDSIEKRFAVDSYLFTWRAQWIKSIPLQHRSEWVGDKLRFIEIKSWAFILSHTICKVMRLGKERGREGEKGLKKRKNTKIMNENNACYHRI